MKQPSIIVRDSIDNSENDHTKRKSNSIRDVKYIYWQFIQFYKRMKDYFIEKTWLKDNMIKYNLEFDWFQI